MNEIPDNIHIAIEDLKNDFNSGATDIALKGLDIIFEASLYCSEKLTNVAELITEAKPSMAALKNIMKLFVRLNSENILSGKEIREIIKDKMHRATEQVINSASQYLIENNYQYIMTCSHSSTISKIFSLMHQTGWNLNVNLLQSVWNGRDYAELFKHQLDQNGIKPEYFAVEHINSAIQNSDCILLGADCISTDNWAVNGTPSGYLARYANKRIPLMIVAESFKNGDKPHLADGYDFIEPNLISRIISDEFFK